ncbi:MAG: helix-turn-helix transcriptional regulator [Paenibacillaceae bacterium]|nr:helix-turn-helix transcriptional regulator [Paenibacillaceae bacterium]
MEETATKKKGDRMSSFYVFRSSLDDLELKLRWAMDVQRAPEWTLDRINPYTIGWLVLAGSRTLHAGSGTHVLGRGDLVLFPPQVRIRVAPGHEEREPFRYLALGCEAKRNAFDWVSLYRMPLLTNIAGADDSSFERLAALWLELIAQMNALVSPAAAPSKRIVGQRDRHPTLLLEFGTHEAIAYLALLGKLYEWLGLVMAIVEPQLPEAPGAIDPRLQRICAHIREHLHLELQLPDLAKLALLSESHLRLLFRRQLGMSPMKYVREARLQRVRELLIATDRRIRDIAESVGFAEQSRFSTAFRKAEGIGPQQYRKLRSGV